MPELKIGDITARVITEQEGHDHDVCPGCGEELCGGLIAEKVYDPSAYGNSLCFSQLVGIEVRERFDGVSYWHCPLCNLTWNRFDGTVVPPKPTVVE